VLFIWSYKDGNTKHALEQALTLLIVTCPCALAIATPLTFIRTLSKSAQKGIIIKDDSVIEKLARVQNVFIDKTGTITENSLEISSFYTLQNSTVEPYDVIHNLEKHSIHPLAVSLKNYIKPFAFKTLLVSDLKEVPGIGVSGIIDNHLYEIKNHSIFEDHTLICTFEANDTVRKDARLAIEKLGEHKVQIQILSGDKEEYVQKMAKEVGLTLEEYQSGMSPEKKSQVIKSSENSLMIGDGANDAIALSYADTGIAVYGAMDISLRAADVYLSLPGLIPVAELITISKETMKVIYRNLVLSLFYNSISVLLAFTGYISPLTAAIIMPLSSLSVLISTLIGTKKLRMLWK
jgi:Cu2+-exporting ATPase/Cu+-exporting ATPase